MSQPDPSLELGEKGTAYSLSSSEIEAEPPRPPSLLMPAVVLLLVVVGVLTPVLLAHDARNLHLLAKVLHIALGEKQPQRVSDPAKPLPRSQDRRQDSAPAHLLGPADLPLSLIEAPVRPSAFCQSLSLPGQELPNFVGSDDDSWECSLLRQYPAASGSSSLFFQLRGAAKGAFSGFRIKFSLSSEGLSQPMLDDALAVLHQHVRPLWDDTKLRSALSAKLRGKADFAFVAGYYRASFKHELSDANRSNLIVSNRGVPQAEPLRLPLSWIVLLAPVGARAHKGSRPVASGSQLSVP
jgi:hypothetical protein